MFSKIDSWFREWLKENATEKLVSLMLAIIIIFGFSIRELYRKNENSYEKTISYLKEEAKACKELSVVKDRRIETLEREFRITLLKMKFNISQQLDSMNNEKARFN